MKITATFTALLLVVASIYSQKNCQKEPAKTYYFIYNASVELKAYYCSNNDEEDWNCKYFNQGKVYEMQNIPSDVPLNCRNGLFTRFINFVIRKRTKPNYCELSVRANLLSKTVTFPDNSLCLYYNKTCYVEYIAKDVFWNVQDDNRERLKLIVNDNFTVWINERHQTKFISDELVRLILKEKINFCGSEMWKTNYFGILASQEYPTTKERNGGYTNLTSNFDEFCDNRRTTIDPSTSVAMQKMWYVYRYPPNVTINMCFTNLTNTCEETNLTRTIPEDTLDLQIQCARNFCNTSSCIPSQAVVCQATTQVDLENDQVRGLPKCKYSDGLCEPIQAFWEHRNRCYDIHKVYEAYEGSCEGARCVTDRNNSIVFLLRQGSFCGHRVWYTNQDGLVASETELRLPTPATGEDLDLLLSQQSEKISNLRKSLFCALLIVLFCVLWYVFNVIVNCVTLRRLNRTRESKRRVPVVHCLSQGLTTHYLCLSHEENNKLANEVKASELYESVNNELYNKPL